MISNHRIYIKLYHIAKFNQIKIIKTFNLLTTILFLS